MTKVPVSQTDGFPITEMYESPEQTLAFGSSILLTHGLNNEPLFAQAHLVCKIAQLNYSVGNKHPVNIAGEFDGAQNRGVSFVLNETPTQIRLQFGTNANVFAIHDKTTGAMNNITAANWRLVVRAFA